MAGSLHIAVAAKLGATLEGRVFRAGFRLALVCLLVDDVSLVRAQPRYPIFTEANLVRAMKTVGSSVASGNASLAANDHRTAKAQFVRAREELAVTVTFWRDRNKDAAVRMLRDTLKRLDELDTALSAQPADRTAEALARRVDEACESCQAVHREQDPSTKAYRLRPGSI